MLTLKTKMLPHEHSGKVRPHHHTSYGSLVVILLVALTTTLSVSQLAFAGPGDTSGGGSYQSYAVVPSPVPATAPVIALPKSGTVVTNSEQLSVQGSCPSQTLVKVFSNEVLLGAALCQNGGFSLQITPFVGNNSLVARAFNTNDEASPDSVPVSVQLNLNGAATVAALNSQGAPLGQFFVTSEISHRGVSVGQDISWPVIISGGQAPYAINISWGDGKTDLISRGLAGRFDISHSYDKPGGYRGYTVMITSVDNTGQKSFIQLVAIVSGQQPAGVVTAAKQGYQKSTPLRIAWQLLLGAVILVVAFWLGEKRELYSLRHNVVQSSKV